MKKVSMLLRMAFIPFLLLPISLLTILFVGCSQDDTCPKDHSNDWEFIGNDQVDIDTIISPKRISIRDSLSIRIHGKTIRGDRFDNVSIDMERGSLSIVFCLYADIYNWRECGIMPPTSLWPSCDTVLAPPFNEGYIRLIANQSYGYDTISTVIVLQ